MTVTLWQECLSCLQDEISSQQFNTWIRPLQVEKKDNGLRILAPNKYILNQVDDQFLSRIREILAGYGTQTVSLEIGSRQTQSVANGGRFRRADDNFFASKRGSIPRLHSMLALNKEFTFDTFVEGSSNQLAKAAAVQVSASDGAGYNPLLLYGGSGLGKTHLMHALGNAILERNPHINVAYMYAQRFMEDMVRAIEQGRMSKFTDNYRSVDVLLMDDIQFLAKGIKSQEEFFHVFNRLQEDGRQIVLTCDRYPKEVQGLEERLESRFVWGMTARIEPPELETRVAILLKKAELDKVHLPQEAAFVIAERIRSNVRELEGALKRVIANAMFTGRAITVQQVKESLKDIFGINDRKIGIDNIQKTVAEYYKIRISDLHSKRRNRSVTRPRQLAMAIAKELTNHSLPEIGDAFGGRDHSTVLHACKKIEELKENNENMAEDYNNLMRILTT